MLEFIMAFAGGCRGEQNEESVIVTIHKGHNKRTSTILNIVGVTGV